MPNASTTNIGGRQTVVAAMASLPMVWPEKNRIDAAVKCLGQGCDNGHAENFRSRPETLPSTDFVPSDPIDGWLLGIRDWSGV